MKGLVNMKASDVSAALMDKAAKVSDKNVAAYLQLGAKSIDALLEAVEEERGKRRKAQQAARHANKRCRDAMVAALNDLDSELGSG